MGEVAPLIARDPIWTGYSIEEIPQEVPRLIWRSLAPAPARHFEVLQQWEGVVSEVTHDAVWAELLDLTDRSKPLEVIELPLAEVPKPDWPLLAPGSVFYWCIGYERSQGGQIRRVSEIRVRRAPLWSEHAINSIQTKGLELFRRFSGNGEDRSTGSGGA